MGLEGREASPRTPAPPKTDFQRGVSMTSRDLGMARDWQLATSGFVITCGVDWAKNL